MSLGGSQVSYKWKIVNGVSNAIRGVLPCYLISKESFKGLNNFLTSSHGRVFSGALHSILDFFEFE